MYEVNVEQAALRSAVQNAVEIQSRQVLREMLEDGAEFAAVVNCVLVWSTDTRGIAFIKGRDVWHVQRTDGFYIENEKGDEQVFRSFHELLQWLFNQPEIAK